MTRAREAGGETREAGGETARVGDKMCVHSTVSAEGAIASAK